MTSNTTNKFALKVRERAVRMVSDDERDDLSRWAASPLRLQTNGRRWNARFANCGKAPLIPHMAQLLGNGGRTAKSPPAARSRSRRSKIDLLAADPPIRRSADPPHRHATSVRPGNSEPADRRASASPRQAQRTRARGSRPLRNVAGEQFRGAPDQSAQSVEPRRFVLYDPE